MNINDRIKEIKTRVKQLTDHFSYNDDMINILTLCYLAITTFDSDVEDILEEVLSTRYILINSGQFDDMLEKYYPRVDLNQDTYVPPSFDDKRIYKNDFIVIRHDGTNLINRDTCDILDSFLHEIKHAMNSIINSYSNESGKGEFYCGLFGIHDEDVFVILDEAFNSFLVKVYLNIIKFLSREKIEDEEIKRILERFKFSGYTYSYARVTKLLEPLFCNTRLFTLFYNAALYKDCNLLFEELEAIFGDDIFYVLDVLLKKYYYKGNDAVLKYFRHLKFRSRRFNIRFKL